MRAATVLLAVTALNASCSNGTSSRSSPSTTAAFEASTSSVATSTSTTTVVSSTTATSRLTTTSVASSPESYAAALYAAWTQGDRAAAARVAEPQAVTDLFSRQWLAGDGWSFAECSGAAGSVICTWRRPAGQQLLLRVQAAGRTVAVAEVRFQP